MFANLQNANIKDSSWLKESIFLVEKIWGMELNVVKGKESRSNFRNQIIRNQSISEWENKVINIEKKNIFVESGP